MLTIVKSGPQGRRGVCWEETGCSSAWERLLAQHQQISSRFFGGKCIAGAREGT